MAGRRRRARRLRRAGARDPEAATEGGRVMRRWTLRLGGALLAVAILLASFVFGVSAYCVVAPVVVAIPQIGAGSCGTFLMGASALLTPVIGAIAAYVAYQQYRTARTTLKIHLYERRVEILRG